MSWKAILGMAVTLGLTWGARFEAQVLETESDVHGLDTAGGLDPQGASAVLKAARTSPPADGDAEVGASTVDTAPGAENWPRSPSKEVPCKKSSMGGDLVRCKDHEEDKAKDNIDQEELEADFKLAAEYSVTNLQRDRYLLCAGCGSWSPSWWMKGAEEESQAPASRIVGGEETLLGAHPWVVNINARCTGVLISRNWVLTAAHCLTSKILDVWVGIDVHPSSLEKEEKELYHFTSKRFVRHPGFDGSVGSDDLGLIELDRPVTLSGFVGPVCLAAEEDVRPELLALTVGWGDTGTGPESRDHHGSNLLQDAPLYILPDEVCRGWALNQPDPYKFLCAYNHGRDTCAGDSGGPLLLQKDSGRWVLAGILSYGNRQCAQRWSPSVYVRIPRFLNWIKKVVADTNEC